MKTATKVKKPPALKKHDRVALICPASRPESPAVVKHCQQIVSELGFTPVLGKSILNTCGYMAGSLMERLEDLNTALHDDSIAGIFCLSGGFGSLHLLSYLDYEKIAAHPKVIIGGDDNTHLLAAISACSGVVTLHGPNLDQVNSKSTFEHLKLAITSKTHLPPLAAGSLHSNGFMKPTVYAAYDGDVIGRLLGGNLTALVSLLGTPYEPDFNSAILFLEDRDERFDTLDRWLTSLYIAGQLQRLSGVALGQFEGCGTKSSFNMLSLEDLFGDRLKLLKVPCCFGFPFGQAGDTAVIPTGVTAHLDTARGILEFSESALS